jgi:hypothetical protein
VRGWLARQQIARMALDTLRLLTIGGWVREWAHRVRLRLASSHPGEDWWHAFTIRPHPS